jgi:hypothetical protein
MYNPLTNYFSLSLARDDEFQKLSETVLLNLFDSNAKIHASKTDKHAFEAKLFSNKAHKLNYLLVKKDNKISVYEEPIYTWKNTPFDYAIKELKSGSYEVHAREIISLPITGGDEIVAMARILKKYFDNIIKKHLSPDEKKECDELAAKLQADPELDKQVMEKLKIVYNGDFSCTSSPYKLKVFFEYLYNQGLLSSPVPDEKWVEKNQLANKAATVEFEQLKTDINFLFDVCEKNKFTSKKKYQFNDGDNFLFSQDNGIVVESQGMASYITMKSEEITIYAADNEGEGFFKHNKLKELLAGIKSGQDSMIDSVILKANNNQVEYINLNSWYCLSSDVENTRKNVISDGVGEMSYPIDIQSFDYQLKYAQQNYDFTKFEFLASRFMTYSSESYYDKELGIFKNEDITYSKKVADSKIDDTEIPEKFSYCIPIKKIPYLQKEWLEGLEYMVDVLKTNAPIPTVSNTDDKVQDIKDAALHFEAMIPKLKEKLKKQDKLKM